MAGPRPQGPSQALGKETSQNAASYPQVGSPELMERGAHDPTSQLGVNEVEI